MRLAHAKLLCLPRRPPEMDVPPPGKAVLSMSGLSHSVIRVDTEEKLSVLTVQDVGQVMPGGTMHRGDVITQSKDMMPQRSSEQTNL